MKLTKVGKCQLFTSVNTFSFPEVVENEERSHTITLIPECDNEKDDFFEEAAFVQTLPTERELNERRATDGKGACCYLQ